MAVMLTVYFFPVKYLDTASNLNIKAFSSVFSVYRSVSKILIYNPNSP